MRGKCGLPPSGINRKLDTASFAHNVFINCPFDDRYESLFEAIVFTVMDCGFSPRCALEASNAAQVRIEKIFTIIEESKLGIHDISRTELDATTGLPRFNMPLELGMFLAARRFGNAFQKTKSCIILDCETFRYQKFMSDIAGQDITAHGNQPDVMIDRLRNWLSHHRTDRLLPGGHAIALRFATFRTELATMRGDLRLNQKPTIFTDLVYLIRSWLKDNAP